MATVLYKYDQEIGMVSEMFDGADVGNLIANGGWHPRKEDAYPKKEVSEPEKPEKKRRPRAAKKK